MTTDDEDEMRRALREQLDALQVIVDTPDGARVVNLEMSPAVVRALYDALLGLIACVAGFDRFGTPPSRERVREQIRVAREAVRLARGV